MNLKYTVTTSADGAGRLMQRLDTEFQGVRETIIQQVIDTKDAQVRAGLIKLGWTPPEEIGAIDIPMLGGGYRRVTTADVLKMEKQIRLIADALHL